LSFALDSLLSSTRYSFCGAHSCTALWRFRAAAVA